MAGGDKFGCCGFVQGLCGLVGAFLFPRSRGFPVENPRDLRLSYQVSRTGSPWEGGISSRSGHPPALTVCAPRPHPARGAGRGTSNAHTAQISHPPALTVRPSSATRVQSGTGNSHTAPVSCPLALTVSAPRASPATRVRSGTSNSHTAPVTRPLALTVSAPRAPPATRVQSGTSNSHTAPTSHPSALTVSVPRASPSTRVQSGTIDSHTAPVSRPPALTVSVPRASPATRVQSGIINSHTAPVSRPLALTVTVQRASHATRVQSGTSNSHTSPISHPPALIVSVPRASSATRVQSGSKWNSQPQQSDDDDDEDDCVILDSDPHSAVVVTDATEGRARDGGSDEELQIVAEKGKVACRDFPHSRHLCSNMPFCTTSHEKHCTMCYCFVCDAPAPCSYWGKALSVDDHCHATDKETKWKLLRQTFKQRSNGSGTSNCHTAQTSHLLALTVGAPRAHPAAGAGRGTTNTHTAQIFHQLALTVTTTRASSATRVQRVTSNAHTAQNSHPPALTVSTPRASSATRVQSGTGNGHSAQVTHPVEPTASAPRPHPEPGAGRGTSNAHTALVTHPAEPSVSAARPYSAARTGRGASNDHTSQITHPVEATMSATRGYPAGRTGRGISNAQTDQITRSVEQSVNGPRVNPVARAGSNSINAHSGQIPYRATANGYLPESDAPEGATVYVRNLPYHIDNESLKLTFQQAGVVMFSKVIYDRETGQSRGFGYVTMNTVQEAEAAVRIYHGSEVYGRRLTVNIAAPRGGARVDTARRQSGSPIRIFVCNLPTQMDRSRLEELFSKHGKVVDARVVYERRGEAWCSRGFGFVTMATEEESNNAIHALDKQVLEGHALGVKVARERPERGSPSLSNQTPLQNAVTQNQNTRTSVRGSLNAEPTVTVPRARSVTTNAYTAQVTHRIDPTVSTSRPREHRILDVEG